MTASAPWKGAPETPKSVRTLDPEAYALGKVYATLIGIGAATAPRSTQNEIGSSELGQGCDRRLAYRLYGVPPTNTRDPLTTLIGTGFHAGMAEMFTRLSGMTRGRFLVETPVVYRDVPGTCDLYDVETKTVIDWKTSTLDKISHYKTRGPEFGYIVQTMAYAAGLIERGYDVSHVALVFVPRDGKTLNQLWVWRAAFDRSVVDAAIDRVNELRGTPPRDATASPDHLCGWCNHYLPGSRDLSVGCPGKES